MIEIGPNLATVIMAAISLVSATIATIRAERALSEVKHAREHIAHNARRIDDIASGRRAARRFEEDT